jgi:hypothetical protein
MIKVECLRTGEKYDDDNNNNSVTILIMFLVFSLLLQAISVCTALRHCKRIL